MPDRCFSPQVALVSDWVRGKEFSVVTLTLRKADGQQVSLRVVRQRVPGTKTELLGALWQTPSYKEFEALTYEGKEEKLVELHRRGNLSRTELNVAKARLRENRPIPLPSPKGASPASPVFSVEEDPKRRVSSRETQAEPPPADRYPWDLF